MTTIPSPESALGLDLRQELALIPLNHVRLVILNIVITIIVIIAVLLHILLILFSDIPDLVQAFYLRPWLDRRLM